MMKPKKRLSAGMGFSADGIDPQFEFDVPRIFVDLTLPPKYVKAPFPTDGDASPHALLAHDPWFDLVHEYHSRPTEEFLAEQEDQHSHNHTATASGSGSAHRQLHNHQSTADGEKENTGGGAGARLKRRNVAYSVKSEDEKTKAALRTASAVAGGGMAASGAAKKKLPFGNSTMTAVASKQAAATTTSARKRPANEKTPAAVGSGSARSRTLPAVASGSSLSTSTAADKDLHDLQALLAKHNKKFKSNHTYEPRQHSVRDVRHWERQTHKSYYKLSSDDRIKANAEIALLVQEREL